jgi:hypothetical protein
MVEIQTRNTITFKSIVKYLIIVSKFVIYIDHYDIEELNLKQHGGASEVPTSYTPDLKDNKDFNDLEISEELEGENIISRKISEIKEAFYKGLAYASDQVSYMIGLFFFAATFPIIPFFAIMGVMSSFLKYMSFKIRGL